MAVKKDLTAAGVLSEKKRKDTPFRTRQKNGYMLDLIRLLSVWSPVITIGRSEARPVIHHYIQQTMNLTNDHNKLKQVAFSHSPKGTDSTKDWLHFFKNQDACDQGKELTPPRYSKGEMTTELEIINYQSTLKSLAKVSGMKTYAVTFNLSKPIITKAEQTKDATKSITEKLNYRFRSSFDQIPDYFLTTEYATLRETKNGFIKGEKRRHLHGTILLDPKDVEKAKQCFKEVNPEARSILLVEQPDILNFYPIRWGGYVTKSTEEAAELTNHPVYATSNLKTEAKHHYNALRAIIIEYQSGTMPESLRPSDRLKELEAEQTKQIEQEAGTNHARKAHKPRNKDPDSDVEISGIQPTSHCRKDWRFSFLCEASQCVHSKGWAIYHHDTRRPERACSESDRRYNKTRAGGIASG